MTLTVPDLTPTTSCAVVVTAADGETRIRIQLTPEQMDTLTDTELDAQISDLVSATSALTPGREVQFTKEWSGNALSAVWQTA